MRLYLRLASVTVGCAVGLAVVGFFPTVRLGDDVAVSAMGCGILVSLVAGLAGGVPVCLATANGQGNVPIAVLLGTALRFLIVLILVVALTFSGLVDRVAFVTWVGISYLVLLLVDTLAALACVRSARGASR